MNAELDPFVGAVQWVPATASILARDRMTAAVAVTRIRAGTVVWVGEAPSVAEVAVDLLQVVAGETVLVERPWVPAKLSRDAV